MTTSRAKIVMYSTPFCGYCAAAKRLLESKAAAFIDIDLFNNPDEREKMIEASGRTTVPQIFINQRHIGGYDDLEALDNAGELDALLADEPPNNSDN